MIIQCKGCSRQFQVKDRDIPKEGRMVQCGYCSQKWFQVPIKIQSSVESRIDENASKMEFEASDGRTYKFLGKQWAEVFRSGGTGMLAKRKIATELNKLAGITTPKKSRKRVREVEEIEINNIEKVIDPSSEEIDKQLPNVYKTKKGLGFFGYISLLIIITLSIVGVLKTFQNEVLIYLPQAEYLFEIFDNMIIIVKDLIKSEYIVETFDNMILIVKDMFKSY